MITYKDIREFRADELKELFLSVGWSSGHYSDKLVEALGNSSTVFSAWDGDRLVGLANALDDGIITAYVHYLLVHPDYQGRGIARNLLERMKTRYRDFLRIALICYNRDQGFFKACGFEVEPGSSPCFLTSLWT